jgi:hypothetical protein
MIELLGEKNLIIAYFGYLAPNPKGRSAALTNSLGQNKTHSLCQHYIAFRGFCVRTFLEALVESGKLRRFSAGA